MISKSFKVIAVCVVPGVLSIRIVDHDRQSDTSTQSNFNGGRCVAGPDHDQSWLGDSHSGHNDTSSDREETCLTALLRCFGGGASDSDDVGMTALDKPAAAARGNVIFDEAKKNVDQRLAEAESRQAYAKELLKSLNQNHDKTQLEEHVPFSNAPEASIPVLEFDKINAIVDESSTAPKQAQEDLKSLAVNDPIKSLHYTHSDSADFFSTPCA